MNFDDAGLLFTAGIDAEQSPQAISMICALSNTSTSKPNIRPSSMAVSAKPVALRCPAGVLHSSRATVAAPPGGPVTDWFSRQRINQVIITSLRNNILMSGQTIDISDTDHQ